MKKLLKYFVYRVCSVTIFLTLFLLIGCREEDKTEDVISNVQIDFSLFRFDREFAQADADDISDLKKKYPYLFPEQFSDSIWIAKLSDTIQLELSGEVDKTFGDFNKEANDLEALFRHIVYYFPQYKVPKVVTVISDVRYNDRIILTDSLLLIGLDNYLGEDHHFYGRVQRYIAQGLDRRYLTSDIASAFAKKVIKYPRNRSFLARMIYYGKELYLKDKLLPNISDAQRIGYTDDELLWAQTSEEDIWKYFVERELLYDTDSKLDRRFLDPAPFSKFQLELDSESPGRLGRYIGWQIVRSFMERNNVSLVQLLNLPADEIFKKSNYKPRK